ncbi:DUF3352 domain-containing protein [Daejeonella oryzae]|uniref:DUF3352 domain-containing protein n=1 Tax=Daejeonella oryzae TaxID=1122943 RepID=UPI000406402E|nr:DUF3352 domain-containing protein [Daejeonella oryzae]
MNKIIIYISILVIAVFSVAYLYFSNLNIGSKNNDKALSLIPQSAALIFSFTNDKSFYEIFKEYELFDAITGTKNKVEFAALKEGLLDSRTLRLITSGQTLFLSFHPQKSDSIATLWTMPLLKEVSREDFIQALNQNKKISSKWFDLNGIQFTEINILSINKPFYLFMNKGVATGSFSQKLLLETINNKVPKIEADFIEEINSGSLKSSNSPANVFLNLGGSKEFLLAFLRQKKTNGNFNLLNNLSGFSTLNMNYKSDALMFDGITVTDTLKSSYLNLFLHQQPVSNPITRIVPENTAYFLAFGISDYRVFAKDLKEFHRKENQLSKLNEQISLITKETGIQPNRDIQKYWGNEFIFFQLSNREKLGAVKLSNGRQMNFFLQSLSSEYSENIWRLNYSGILYNYFGEPFKSFESPFYSIIDNYLIVSNSPGSIQRFLNNYNSENLLYKTSKFQEFNRLVSDKSNMLLFIHSQNSKDNFNSLLKRSYTKTLNDKDHGFKNFYGVSYQWSSDGNRFFTNFYAATKQLVEPKLKDIETDSLQTN